MSVVGYNLWFIPAALSIIVALDYASSRHYRIMADTGQQTGAKHIAAAHTRGDPGRAGLIKQSSFRGWHPPPRTTTGLTQSLPPDEKGIGCSGELLRAAGKSRLAATPILGVQEKLVGRTFTTPCSSLGGAGSSLQGRQGSRRSRTPTENGNLRQIDDATTRPPNWARACRRNCERRRLRCS